MPENGAQQCDVNVPVTFQLCHLISIVLESRFVSSTMLMIAQLQIDRSSKHGRLADSAMASVKSAREAEGGRHEASICDHAGLADCRMSKIAAIDIPRHSFGVPAMHPVDGLLLTAESFEQQMPPPY